MEAFRYYKVERHRDVIVAEFRDAQLHGETMAEMLRHELLEITHQLSPKAVILDFSHVTMISSSIVSYLLVVDQKLKGMGIQLKLTTINETLQSIFKTLRLDRKFTFFQTTDQALDSPTGPATYQDIVGRPTPWNLDDDDA